MFLRRLMRVPPAFDACSSDVWCMFLRNWMSIPQAFVHLYFGYTRRSASCGFPKYVWGKDCDVIVTFLICSPDVWCKFLRRLMSIPQAFGQLYFGYIWRSTSCGFPKYVWGKDCDIIVKFLTCYSDVWCVFLRRLMRVPQTFDVCSSGCWSLILRVHNKKYILWLTKVCLG
jgi:hypothetical protein